MEQDAWLIDRYFAVRNGELLIGGIAVPELAAHYGTPLFVYDASVIDRKWDLLRNALPPEFSIYYSVKANPSQTILKRFLAKGAGLEIASAGEFHQARSARCPPEKIVFAGPGKTEAELELVLSQEIGEIHVESLREAERIATIARRRGMRARVALRVNPGGEAEGGAMRMGGRPAPFGVDEENLDELLGQLLLMDALEIAGIHVFIGTQILDFEVLLSQYRKGLDIARRAAAVLKRPLSTLDFGGGLGIPYFAHEKSIDEGKLREGMDALIATVHGDSCFSGTRFFLEPGRYLVGEAGVYVTRINDIKNSRGKKFLICDGGMNHQLAASGNLGQTIKRNYPVAVLNKLGRPADEVADVVGPLCTPLDVLARGIALPNADVGDLVGVFQSGAYARSSSPLGFLSHPAPPEVWIDNGTHRLIRRRGEPDDYLHDQC
ncbi:MAG: type III PLP-dependent enzyme [Bryobacteraceae bacterium]